MPVGTTGFIGKRLIEAREARGLTNGSLAELLGVSTTAISQYEKGTVSPRPEVMVTIAERLNLPQSFFMRPLDGKSNEDALFWRSMSSATQAARTKAKRRFRWLKDIVSYLREFLDLPHVQLPSIEGLPSNPLELTDRQIEDIAQQCRAFWKISDAPIADLILLFENNGIIVSRGKLEAEKLDAFSQFQESDGTPFIFLTADKNSAVRSRLDAVHELGHLILHRSVQEKHLANPKTYKLIEDQAFLFGSSFLLPAKSFTRELWSPTLDAFRSLKERWKVSIGVMIKRCQELSLITDTEAKRMWINYNRRDWRIREPLDDLLVPEQPRLLRRSFELLISHGLKTREQILLDLPFASTDIEDLAGLPQGYLTGELGQIAFMPKIKEPATTQLGSGEVLPFQRPKS